MEPEAPFPNSHASGHEAFGPRAPPVEHEAEQYGECGACGQAQEEAKLVLSAAGWDDRNDDAEQDYEEAQAATYPNAEDAAGDKDSVCILGAALPVGELDDGCKHVEEGNEVEDDAGVDQFLVGALHRLVDLTSEQDGCGDGGLDEDGYPGRLPAGVDLAEGRGQVAVDADDKGHSGDAGHG